jgi:hypothetical protein
MLASKGMFRPQSTKRRSSISVQQVLDNISNTETREAVEGRDTALTQALAADHVSRSDTDPNMHKLLLLLLAQRPDRSRVCRMSALHQSTLHLIPADSTG